MIRPAAMVALIAGAVVGAGGAGTRPPPPGPLVTVVHKAFIGDTGPSRYPDLVSIEYGGGAEVPLVLTNRQFVGRLPADAAGPASILVHYGPRRVVLPVKIAPEGRPMAFAVHDGSEPICSVDMREYLALPGQEDSAHLDAYFRARRLVRDGICRTPENRAEVGELWLERACSVAQRYPYIRLDLDAVDRMVRSSDTKLRRMAQRAKNACQYGKTDLLR